MSVKKVSQLTIFFIFLGIIIPVFGLAHELDSTTIHMSSESGFEPTEIEIEQGESVVFENTGQTVMWPASNIHPTHRAYPGSGIELCHQKINEELNNPDIFDACGGIESGEVYKFTFSKPGRWRYHDHLNPNLSGVVIVEALESDENLEIDDKPKRSFKDWWSDLKLSFTKLYYKVFPNKLETKLEGIKMMEIAHDKEELYYWLKLLGAQEAMQMVLAEADGGSLIDCHTEAHQLGRAAFDIYGARVFSEGDSSCHSGFYHGAMETFLAKNGTENLDQKIKELCEIFDTRFGLFECLHGVGHGVLAYEDYDLSQAINVCGELEGSFAQSSCYGGMFMENIVTGQGNGAIPGHETDWVNRTDPHFPCNAISQDRTVQVQCYQMQTSWMLTQNSYNFGRVAEICQATPESMIPVCFKSLGRDAAGHTLRNPDKIVDICGKVIGTEYYDECIYGAVNVIVDFWGEKLEGQASELCGLLVESEKLACYQVLAGRLPGLFNLPAERLSICNTFEPEFQWLCNK
jgi:plastocyanin